MRKRQAFLKNWPPPKLSHVTYNAGVTKEEIDDFVRELRDPDVKVRMRNTIPIFAHFQRALNYMYEQTTPSSSTSRRSYSEKNLGNHPLEIIYATSTSSVDDDSELGKVKA